MLTKTHPLHHLLPFTKNCATLKKANDARQLNAGPIFRWHHNLSVNWTKAEYSAGLAIHHKSGYKDFEPTNVVSSYTTADVYGGWTPSKGVKLLVGIRNLANTPPPFTNQSDLFQSGGWDSRYASAFGRTLYMRGTVAF